MTVKRGLAFLRVILQGSARPGPALSLKAASLLHDAILRKNSSLPLRLSKRENEGCTDASPEESEIEDFAEGTIQKASGGGAQRKTSTIAFKWAENLDCR